MDRPDIGNAIGRLRQRAPLVHNITNYVVMNITANALLAAGASPAMVHAAEEAGEFAGIAGALVINIGTLSPHWVTAMELAANAAVSKGVPWILDPVAAGATAYRTKTAAALAKLKPSVIRGNASEIMALAGESGAAKGVDSTQGSEAATNAARHLARSTGATVAVTGAVDYITDGSRMIGIANGDAMLTRVTGTGCSATALIGAFLGAGLAPYDAAAAGLAMISIAAELALPKANGPGSFAVALIDALASVDDGTVATRVHLR
jgi:hydroxyethylthiazole kinase